MTRTPALLSVVLGALTCVAATAFGIFTAHAGVPPAAATPACKAYNNGSCCDPAMEAHLPLKMVFTACGESDTTYLGEQATKDGCKYFFKVEGEKPEDSMVQIYSPKMKDVPPSPQDPFFTWKRVGKAFMIERANSPKAAAMSVGSTGLWMPGKGYFVSVTASTKVCSKKEATKLAAAMR